MRALPRGGLVLVDGYRGRISKGEALQKVQSVSSVYPTLQLIAVESIGKGDDFYSDLVLLDDIYGYPLKLYEIPSHGRKSKGDRFEDYLAPKFPADYKQRNVGLDVYEGDKALEVVNEVKKWRDYFNDFEAQILACTSKEEVQTIDFRTEEDKAKDEEMLI